MATQFHVNPRFRAYGRARLEIAQRARTREEWNDLWKPPQNTFPFTWGRHWKHCVEYRVDDYAAEAGFYIDVLGFPVNAFDPHYAQFTGPDGEFYIAFMPASEDIPATPPDALRLQFMIADLPATTAELDRRGVIFDQQPSPLATGSNLLVASFRTPHGIQVDLWGEAPTSKAMEQETSSAKSTKPIVDRNRNSTTTVSRQPDYSIAGQPVFTNKPNRRAPAPEVVNKPREDMEETPVNGDRSEGIPEVEHFFPVRAPGKHRTVRNKLKIRLAEPRPLILREPV